MLGSVSVRKGLGRKPALQGLRSAGGLRSTGAARPRLEGNKVRARP